MKEVKPHDRIPHIYKTSTTCWDYAGPLTMFQWVVHVRTRAVHVQTCAVHVWTRTVHVHTHAVHVQTHAVPLQQATHNIPVPTGDLLQTTIIVQPKVILLNVPLQIHSSKELSPTSRTDTLNMLSDMSVQVAPPKELLAACLTAVVFDVEVNRENVSFHHGSAVLSFEFSLAELAFLPLFVASFKRLDVVVWKQRNWI